MRLPRLSTAGFLSWRAIELTGRQPRYLLSVTAPGENTLDLLFDLARDVVAFIEEHSEQVFRSLQVIAPPGCAGAPSWLLLDVARLETHPDAKGDRCVVVYLTDRQVVRGLDLAPFAPSSPALSTISFE